jgi:hypothetical protein
MSNDMSNLRRRVRFPGSELSRLRGSPTPGSGPARETSRRAGDRRELAALSSIAALLEPGATGLPPAFDFDAFITDSDGTLVPVLERDPEPWQHTDDRESPLICGGVAITARTQAAFQISFCGWSSRAHARAKRRPALILVRFRLLRDMSMS